ncbi:MAG: septum site-determining protein MinC [Comamonadaceae bacterium]|nr:MAG: septum site-determining protein MinC [Comamonadaceae bacterium]
MTVAIAGRAPATFEIKSANLPLVALLLKSADLNALADDLARRFGDIPDFFDNEPLVIDLTPLQSGADEAAIDFNAITTLLRTYRVIPVAARGGSSAQMAAALAAGLAAAPDAVTSLPAQPADAADAADAADPIAQAVIPDSIRDPSPPAAPPAPAPSALVITKPLRSGQQVYARGRDLVVLAMVNAGAEVIADGHIHVYAPLRGKAIAGARGNTDARIFALSLEPELLSIAGIYRTSEVALPDTVRGKPGQVRLGGEPGAEKLLIEPLKN